MFEQDQDRRSGEIGALLALVVTQRRRVARLTAKTRTQDKERALLQALEARAIKLLKDQDAGKRPSTPD